jgi:hypothetical protein
MRYRMLVVSRQSSGDRPYHRWRADIDTDVGTGVYLGVATERTAMAPAFGSGSVGSLTRRLQ